jgi:putative ABC transport system substrate-binding protein
MHIHQLRRREFITLLGSAAVWPVAARAQQPAGGVPRLGYWVTSPETSPLGQLRFAAFRNALARFGWADGRNIRIDRFGPVPGDQARAIAAELVSLAPKVILVQASDHVKALLEETRTIPNRVRGGCRSARQRLGGQLGASRWKRDRLHGL